MGFEMLYGPENFPGLLRNRPLESLAGGNVAADRASHAGKVNR